eukprot:1003837_1
MHSFQCIIILIIRLLLINCWKCNPDKTDFLSTLSKLSLSEYGNYTVSGPFSFGYGNSSSSSGNPSTRYGGYRFNPTSSQTSIFPMNGDSAILFHMCIPPKLKYFSFSSTIEVRPKSASEMYIISSPMGPIVNHFDLNTVENINENDGNMNIMTTLVHTADVETWHDILNSFNATSNILFNSLTLDAWRSQYNNDITLNFGKSFAADQFLVIARSSLFEETDEAQDWYTTPQTLVYLIEHKREENTPRIAFDDVEMPSKLSNINEIKLYNDSYFEFIEYIMYNQFDNMNMFDTQLYFLEASAFYGDAYIDCISNNKYCFGYHSDVIYWIQANNHSLYEASIPLSPNFLND